MPLLVRRMPSRVDSALTSRLGRARRRVRRRDVAIPRTATIPGRRVASANQLTGSPAHTRMPRLPYVDPDSAPQSVRELLAGTPLSLLGMVAHAESAFDPWLKYSSALLRRLELDPLLRELAILQVAHLADSPYEWVQHTVIARAVGATDAQIAAVEGDRESDPSLTDEQALLLRFSRDVIVEGSASEQDVARLAERLGPRQVVELLLVIGHYLAIARLIATTGLEPDPPIMAGTLPRDPRG
jgi:4-carboxymuconolactone decarboxylase